MLGADDEAAAVSDDSLLLGDQRSCDVFSLFFIDGFLSFLAFSSGWVTSVNAFLSLLRGEPVFSGVFEISEVRDPELSAIGVDP